MSLHVEDLTKRNLSRQKTDVEKDLLIQALHWPLSSAFFSCYVFLMWGVNMWKIYLGEIFRATKKKKMKRKTANAGTPLTLVLCLSNQLEITVRGRENNILHFSQQEISSLYSVLNIFMGKVANLTSQNVCCLSIFFAPICNVSNYVVLKTWHEYFLE